jgi:hypothetical protein
MWASEGHADGKLGQTLWGASWILGVYWQGGMATEIVTLENYVSAWPQRSEVDSIPRILFCTNNLK